MASPRGSERRLSVDDWIEAGFALLTDRSPNALRIDRLCERLQVTKGSFYWHFADMRAYRAALVEAWGDLRDQDRRRYEQMRDLDPRERLRVMVSSLINPSHFALERVMRVWGLTDEAVAASVRASDGRVLRAIHQAFIDYGFEPDDANLRSATMFAAVIGLLHTSGAAPDASAETLERFLEFVVRP
jgi:AcrR family transcriptional regulator